MRLQQPLFMAVTTAALLSHGLHALPARAQNLAERLSAYTGRNAHGYFGPLVDGFAADLTAGLFHRAYVPESGLNVSLELRGMRVYFGEDRDWFTATTEEYFSPETQAKAPTVVGPSELVIVPGDSGTQYAFPPGFDIRSLSTVVPQLRIGSIYGTEALIRYAFLDQGSAFLGDLTLDLYGAGARHSVSQYFSEFPVDLAVSFFYQHFGMREQGKDGDLVTLQTFTFGVQAGRTYVEPFAGLPIDLEPYAGLALDRIYFDAQYETDPGDRVELHFPGDNVGRLTLGLTLKVPFISVNGEYDVMGDRHDLVRQSAFSIGVAAEFGRPSPSTVTHSKR
jgi:hypothetical protein